MDNIRTPWIVSWDRQVMPPVQSNDSHERFKEMANAYWLPASLVYEYEDKWKVKEWMLLCIAVAETSGWKFGAWQNNIGNVGNNDRWDRVQFNGLADSLNAIWQTLNNRYLWQTQTLGCLSRAWNCSENTKYIYASSQWNWERNMTSCLSTIYGTDINADFNFRK